MDDKVKVVDFLAQMAALTLRVAEAEAKEAEERRLKEEERRLKEEAQAKEAEERRLKEKAQAREAEERRLNEAEDERLRTQNARMGAPAAGKRAASYANGNALPPAPPPVLRADRH